jgi:PAS domain S-box-containing protein
LLKTDNILNLDTDFYVQFIELVEDAVVLLDPVNCKILDMNVSFISLTGYTRNYLVKKNIDELILNKDDILHILGNAEKHGCIKKAKLILIADNGEKIITEVTAKKILLNEKESVLVLMKDIANYRNNNEKPKRDGEKYSSLIEDQTEMITRWKPDGTLAYANKVFCRFFNKEENEILGKQYVLNMPESDLRYFFNNVFKKLSYDNPVITFEHQLILPGNETRWLRWTDRAIFDNGKKIIEYQSVGRDITESKQAEIALKESEAKFRKLVESTNVINWEYDNNTESYIYVSPQAEAILGYPAKEWLEPFFWNNHLHPDDKEWAVKFSNNKINNFEDHEFEYRMIAFDGSVKWFKDITSVELSKGKAAVIYGIIIDITEKKKTEQRLYDTQLRLSILLNNLSNVVFYETGGGRDFITENILGLTGYAADEFIRNKNLFTSLMNPDDAKYIKKSLEQWHKEKEPGILTNEFRIKKNDGTMLWLEDHLFKVTPPDGPKYMTGIMLDVTERKKTEEDIRQKNEEVSLLYEASKIFNSTLEEDEVYNSLYELIVKIIDCDELNIYNYNSGSKSLNHIYKSVKGLSHKILSREADRMFINNYSHLSRVINDAANFSFEGRDITKNKNEKEYYSVLIPLKTEGLTSGIVHLISRNANLVSDEKIQMLDALVQQAALAGSNATLYKQAKNEIEERKKAEEKIKLSLEEKELLIKEIHHRVKNNLQIVSSLLKLQTGYLKDKEAQQMLIESQNRVKSMALVHQKLYQSNDLTNIDFHDYIRQLLFHLFHVYQAKSDKIRLNIRADELKIGVDTAIPCGLIINELVSNSLKHAFPGEYSGTIEVALFLDKLDYFHLSIKDNGIGFPDSIDFRNTSSLGLQLIITLTEQLEGNISMNNSGGTEFQIVFKKDDYKKRV